MKKILILLCLSLLILSPLTLAQVLEIETTEQSSVVIAELNNPLKYSFSIENNGETDEFEIFTFAGVNFFPNKFLIEKGQTKKIDIEGVFLKETLSKTRGEFLITYEIYSSKNKATQGKIQVKIIELANVLNINIRNINPEDTQATIDVINKEKIQLDEIAIKINSPFFETEETFSLSPKETLAITTPINYEKAKKLIAGNYEADISVFYAGKDVETTTNLNYLEKEGLAVSEEKSGFIIRETILKKTNVGNTEIDVNLEKKKDILTRLFTTYNIKPFSSVKQGFFVNYVWNQNLKPGESLTIVEKTNYTFPFILAILIIITVMGVKIFIETSLVITKRVSFVKTKGNELALRIRINVKAKHHLDKIQIIDKVPGMAKVYEKFLVNPDKVEASTRRIFWNLNSLNAGEERSFTYIIYSKIKVVGRFEIPQATALYENRGKKHKVISNKTYFAAETSVRNGID